MGLWDWTGEDRDRVGDALGPDLCVCVAEVGDSREFVGGGGLTAEGVLVEEGCVRF